MLGKLLEPWSTARVDKRLDFRITKGESNIDIPITLPTPVSSKWSQSYSSLPTVKYTNPREAFNNMGNSSKDGVGTVLVTREALINNGSFFFTDDDVTVCFPLGVPSINIDTSPWLMEL